jgi:hypothetical protein
VLLGKDPVSSATECLVSPEAGKIQGLQPVKAMKELRTQSNPMRRDLYKENLKVGLLQRIQFSGSEHFATHVAEGADNRVLYAMITVLGQEVL